MTRPHTAPPGPDVDVDLDRIVGAFDGLMHRLMATHAPELNLLELTMSQTKALYLIVAAGQLRMSELAGRLGVTSSTATGVVDGLVEPRAARPPRGPRRPAAGRRHGHTGGGGDPRVVPRAQRAAACASCSTHVDAADLAVIERAIHVLDAAVTADARHHHRPRGGPFVNRLTEFAVSKRSVTLLLAGALFIAGISAWGSLKQELLPDIEFPVITVVAPYPGAGSQDVADKVAVPIEQAISGVPRLQTVQSTSANSIALVIAQFEYGTDVKEALAAIEEGIVDAGLPEGVDPTAQALNINASPVIIASIAATSEDGLEAAATIARDEIIPELTAIEGVSRADVTGGLEQRLLITLDPTKLAESGVSVAQISGVLTANNLTLPSGQLSDDGTKIPVSTIGTLTSEEQIEDLVVGVTMPAVPPTVPVDPTALGRPQRVAGSGHPAGGPDPDHHRRPRDGRDRRRRHDRLCAHGRQPGPVAVGDQDL